MTGPAAVTRDIVAPWATLEQLPEDAPTAHDPDYQELLWEASEILYRLSGSQYRGEAKRLIALDSYRAQRCWSQTEQMIAASWPSMPLGVRYPGHTPNWETVQLPDSPILAVEEVRIGDEVLDTTGWWAQLPAGLLHRVGGTSWPEHGLQVRYRYGIPPPAGGVRSAILLTVELGKAWARDSSCRLPKRIQTITREGVSVGFFDKFEGLDAGRTGIFDIDLWINSVNPSRLRRRPRVWSPDTAGRRRS